MQPDEPLSARDEISVSGFGLLRCPSCGELAGDLLGRHHLILVQAPGPPEAECRAGKRITLTGFEQFQAAANIALADDIWWRETVDLRATGTPA